MGTYAIAFVAMWVVTIVISANILEKGKPKTYTLALLFCFFLQCAATFCFGAWYVAPSCTCNPCQCTKAVK